VAESFWELFLGATIHNSIPLSSRKEEKRAVAQKFCRDLNQKICALSALFGALQAIVSGEIVP
jgi:hypothetical protein